MIPPLERDTIGKPREEREALDSTLGLPRAICLCGGNSGETWGGEGGGQLDSKSGPPLIWSTVALHPGTVAGSGQWLVDGDAEDAWLCLVTAPCCAFLS